MRRVFALAVLLLAGCANDYGALCDEKLTCTTASDRETCIDELLAAEREANEIGGACPDAFQDMIDCYAREPAGCSGTSVWPSCATSEGRYEDACAAP